MKATELMALLGDLVEEFGDLHVRVGDPGVAVQAVVYAVDEDSMADPFLSIVATCRPVGVRRGLAPGSVIDVEAGWRKLLEPTAQQLATYERQNPPPRAVDDEEHG